MSVYAEILLDEVEEGYPHAAATIRQVIKAVHGEMLIHQ